MMTPEEIRASRDLMQRSKTLAEVAQRLANAANSGNPLADLNAIAMTTHAMVLAYSIVEHGNDRDEVLGVAQRSIEKMLDSLINKAPLN